MKNRQVYAVRDFSGGYVTSKPNTELGNGEFAVMKQMIGDRVSFARSLGTKGVIGAESSDTDITYGSISDGYGLMMMHSDYEYHPTASCDSDPTDLGIVATASGVSIYDFSASVKYNKQYTNIKTAKADMYKIDGTLRIADGNVNSSYQPVWLGYLYREFLQTSASANVYDAKHWVMTDAAIFAPTAGIFSVSESAVLASVSNSTIGNHTVSVYLEEDTDGYDWNKEWEAAATLVFDGNQESLLTPLTGTVTITDEYASAKLTCAILAYESPDYHFNERITAINIYLREVGSQDWLLQSTYSLQTGATLPTDMNGALPAEGGGGVPT